MSIQEKSQLTRGRAFLNVTTAVLLANLLTVAILGLGALIYLAATQTSDPVIVSQKPLSSACLDTLTMNSGQTMVSMPANCAGDSPEAVASHAADLGVILPISEGNS